MSFVVYVQFFHDREPWGVPRKVIRAIFSEVLREIDKDHWQLEYGQGEWCELLLSPITESPDYIHHIAVKRPCQDSHLWEAVFHLLKMENGLFYFPGSGSCITSLSVVEHIPSEILEVLGNPVVIQKASDLVQYVVTV